MNFNLWTEKPDTLWQFVGISAGVFIVFVIILVCGKRRIKDGLADPTNRLWFNEWIREPGLNTISKTTSTTQEVKTLPNVEEKFKNYID